MAKIRRIIRKVKPLAAGGFDDQAWPVNVALIVLGGFLIGVVLAFLRFNDTRVTHNAWTWLMIVPLLIGGMMVALRYVNSRALRRVMQLAIVLSVLIHAIFFIIALNLMVFGKLYPQEASVADSRQTHERKTIPDYFHIPHPDQPKQDFEKPVETTPPETIAANEPVEREQPEETPPAQDQPQPTPVPDPQETERPNVVERKQVAEATPRASDQQSKLSRQTSPSRLQPQNTAADAAQPTATASAAAQPQATAGSVARRTTESQPTARTSKSAEPSATTAAETPQMARRQAETAPTPATTATPTMARAMNQPAAVPKTAVVAAETPAATKQTSETEVQPNTTLAQKQATTSPERTRPTTEVAVATPTDAPAETQRRELPTEPKPTIAQTPVETPNRNPRVTPRPDVAAVASSAAPTNSPTPPQPERSLPEATTNPIRRTTPVAETQRKPPEVETAVSPQTIAAVPRRDPTAQPVAPSVPQNQPTPRRESTSPTVAANSLAPVAKPAPVSNDNASTELTAAASNAAKQAAANAAVAAATPATPTATNSEAPPAATPANQNTRPPQTEPAPTLAQVAPTAVARRNAPAMTNPTNTAATPTQPATNPTATAANPQAVAATVQRQQPAAAAVATPAPPTAEPTVASPAPTAVASNTPRRTTETTPPAPNATAPAAAATARVQPTPAIAAATQAAAQPAAASAPTTAPSETAIAAAATSTNRQPASGAAAAATASPNPASDPNPSPTTTTTPQVARRTTTNTPNVAVNSTPSRTPAAERAATQPAIATSSVAQANPAARPNANSAGESQQLAAATTSTARTATGGAAATAQAGSSPATDAAANATATAAGSPTRQPRGETAPTLAQAATSAPQRRQTPDAIAGVATTAANVAANTSAVRGDTNEPRPSSATVARQAATSTATTSSATALDAPAAAATTQIARAVTSRAESASAPSIRPDAVATASPARSTRNSQLTASPVNAENPAVAAATSGVGSPALAAAHTALNKSTAGTAGVGRSQNFERGAPAEDTPALVASSAARRAEATQNTPAGPALAPTAAALVRHSLAGDLAPQASLQAESVAQTAAASGAANATELAASSGAALTRSDANAAQGAVSAAKGSGDIDLGPTRIVSEGESGRASGGGQPAINLETDSPKLARSENVGGVIQPSFAAETIVDAATAPTTTGGGKPLTPEATLAATGVVRTDAGGAAAQSGGPAKSDETGPPTEVSLSTAVADAAMQRTELAEALPGDPNAGGGNPDDEDEEEKRKRLARQAAAAAIALNTNAADVPALAQAGTAGDPATGGAAAAASTTLAKAATESGEGAPTGQVGEVAPPAGETVVATAAGIARTTPTNAGPPVDGLAGSPSATARTASATNSPAISAQAEGVGAVAAAGVGSLATGPAADVGAVAKTAGAASAGGGPAQSAEPNAAPGGDALAASSAARREMNAGGPAADAAAPSGSPARGTAAALSGPSTAAAVDVQVAAAGNPAGGGKGTVADPAAGATSVARANPAGGSPAISGPASAEIAAAGGPSAAASIDRVAAREAAAGNPAASGGQPNLESPAPVGSQLARRAGTGSPQPALAGPAFTVAAAAPPSSTTAGGGSTGATEIGPQATTVAVATSAAPAGAAVQGELAEVAHLGPSGGSAGGEQLAAAQFTRAEAAEGLAGTPVIGGGTGAPARNAGGPAFTAGSKAETVAIAGAPTSGGAPDGSLIAAQGIDAAKLSGGSNAAMTDGPVGARQGLATIDVQTVGAPGDAVGARQTSPSLADGPAVGDAANPGTPLARAANAGLAAGSAVARIEIPNMGSDTALAQATMEHLMGDMAETDMSKAATESGLAVNVAAPEGPGGLGAEHSVDVGVNNRRASRESIEISTRPIRFVSRNAGGLPNVSTAAIVPTESFRRRTPGDPGNGSGGGQGAPPQTEEAVERGLAFLARYQMPDGSWSLRGIPNESAALVTDTAATGLALLAFQGAGYNHREHRYKDVVLGGVNYLLKNQKADGDLFLPLDDQSNASVWLYSHAVATIVLCEAYGMTQDPELREPAQKAIDFIVASQQPERGGWRYSPQSSSDTSVTGWMMMALKSGELAKLNVPKETYQKINRWLDAAQASGADRHLYRYNPYAPDSETQRHGRNASKTMTAVGLLMRLYSGWKRDRAEMQAGADYLADNAPAIGTIRDPQRDTYYWYYATQVMFHMGGDHWQKWNSHLHPLLVDSQIRNGPMAGSWDPRNPIPDRWAPHAGRLYVTTMNLLSLEVYYRHLPLYEETAK